MKIDLSKKLNEWSRSLPQGSHIWIAAVIFAGVIAIFWDRETSVAETPQADREVAATFIPDGFVLVPIEIANYEALDSILGNHGVVDLYKPNENPSLPPVKVAERVKILRAPLNPQRFAVLAPESESPGLVSHQGAFTVAVQNPKNTDTKFVSSGTPIGNASLQDSVSGIATPKRRLSRSRILVEVSGVP